MHFLSHFGPTSTNELYNEQKVTQMQDLEYGFLSPYLLAYRAGRGTKSVAKGSDGMGTYKDICFLCEVAREQMRKMKLDTSYNDK